MGVPPEKIPDFLALVGDTSDNIPGLKGCGDKTAASLLEQYGSLDNLIAANPVIPRLKQPFSDPEQLARVKLSRQLVELRARRAAADRRSRTWSSPTGTCRRCSQLFTELEFSLLVDKVKMRMPPADDVVVVPAPEAHAVAAVEAPRRHADRHARRRDRRARRRRPAGEADGDHGRARSRARRSRAPGRGRDRGAGAGARVRAARPSLHRRAGAAAARAISRRSTQSLADPAIAKVAHDAKARDPRVRRTSASTVDGHRRRHDARGVPARSDGGGRSRRGGRRSGSAACCCRRARRSRAAASARLARGHRGRARGAVGGRDHARAAADRRRSCRSASPRAACVALPRRRAAGRAAARRGRAHRHPHRHPALPQLLGARSARSSPSSSARSSTLAGAASSTSARPSSSASCCSTSSALDTKGVRKTKTGYSTEAETLEALIDAHPMIAPILEHREISKLKGTYLDALPPLVSREDRAPPHHVQPGRRRDRPDLVAGPEPPEHPDPQRARQADPPRLHRGARVTS